MNEAFFFGGASSGSPQLFGTTTAAARKEKADFGVLVCPAFSEERQKTYRSTFLFAKELAHVGIPSMRFDYAGTGDSDGRLAGTTVGSMVADTVRAHQEAKSRLGVDKMVLLGIRLGAAIAVISADTIQDIDRLVLWNPIVSGKRFFRDLTRTEAMINLARKRSSGSETKSGPEKIEVDAEYVSDDLVDQLKEIDLLTHSFRQASYLITGGKSDKIENRQLERLTDTLRESGNPVDFWNGEIMEFWSSRSMYDAFYPTRTFEETIRWLRGQ